MIGPQHVADGVGTEPAGPVAGHEAANGGVAQDAVKGVGLDGRAVGGGQPGGQLGGGGRPGGEGFGHPQLAEQPRAPGCRRSP